MKKSYTTPKVRKIVVNYKETIVASDFESHTPYVGNQETSNLECSGTIYLYNPPRARGTWVVENC